MQVASCKYANTSVSGSGINSPPDVCGHVIPRGHALRGAKLFGENRLAGARAGLRTVKTEVNGAHGVYTVVSLCFQPDLVCFFFNDKRVTGIRWKRRDKDIIIIGKACRAGSCSGLWFSTR